MQMYFLYHPLFILTFANLRIIGSYPTEQYVPSVLEARYSVTALPISGLVKQIFAENNEDSREARMTFYRHQLINIVQRDFPPFTNEVTIEFMGY
jgi:hypothetical protein